MEKRFYRSSRNKIIAGVCGGLGEYFGIDPVIIRLLWVAAIFIGGAGLLFYIIAWIVIPGAVGDTQQYQNPDGSSYSTSTGESQQKCASSTTDNRKGALAVALIFMFLGVFLLLNKLWDVFSWKYFFGLLFIALGGYNLYTYFKGAKK